MINVTRVSGLNFLLLFFLAFSCTEEEKTASKPDHSSWDELLRSHVDPDGHVDYVGFVNDSSRLRAYLDNLSSNPPDEKNWSEEEKLSYWINTYNAATVYLVVQHYPVQTIKEIGPKIDGMFENTVWDHPFISIGKHKYDLNTLEHDFIRKDFKDPRAHFAIVCATRSCPPLRAEAYLPEKLDKQLSDQTKRFINDPSKNFISDNMVQLSLIFEWYQGDFKNKNGLIGFLNEYSDQPIDPDAEVNYLEFNWDLNSSRGTASS